jgi:hypothetical protein
VRAATLEAYPYGGQRRAQVVDNVVAYTSNFMNQSFNVAQHPINMTAS